MRTRWTSGHSWEQLEFPWTFRRALKINFCGGAPIVSARQIVTFHDAAVFSAPDAFTLAFRLWYRTLFRLQGALSAEVITVSRYSKSELVLHCPIPESKVHVISPAADHILRVSPDGSILRRLGLTTHRYVFSVGSLNPNKNFAAVQNAAALLDLPNLRFVVAGSAGQLAFRQAPLTPGGLQFIGRVTDSELRALYTGALCFVSPSRYEGFGIPPLEAMHCGCPVIAARAAATPETCGSAVLYFDPDRPDELASRILELYGDLSLQTLLRRRGLTQAAGFSWRSSARQLWTVVAAVAGLAGPSRTIEKEELCPEPPPSQ